MQNQLKKAKNESREHFIWRVYKYYRDTPHFTREMAGEVCGNELGESYSESTYRKVAQGFFNIWDEVKQEYISDEGLLTQLDELEKEHDKLYKEKVKYSDKIREYRQLLRDDARIDNLKEVMLEVSKKAPTHKYVGVTPIVENEGIQRTGILLASDWHIGKEVDNIVNQCNYGVIVDRINDVIARTVEECRRFNVTTLYVVNLGDLIEGNLRITARVASEEDVIEQIMLASNLVAYMLEMLVKHGLTVKYGSVLDNHSRANQSWRDHIEKESYAKLIDWYVESHLSDDVEFIKNFIDDNIGYFQLNDKTFVYVHGHLKAHNLSNILSNLTSVIGIKPDYVFLGHWHKVDTSETGFSKIYTNGSLFGVDDYAFESGFYSKPSQSMFIFDESDTDIRIDLNL